MVKQIKGVRSELGRQALRDARVLVQSHIEILEPGSNQKISSHVSETGGYLEQAIGRRRYAAGQPREILRVAIRRRSDPDRISMGLPLWTWLISENCQPSTARFPWNGSS